MKIIGITGGVGAGKTEILNYLKNNCQAVVCQADLVARNLEKKGTICYREIVGQFGQEILQENGRIDRQKLAQLVFGDEEKLACLNGIVHPAVKRRILRMAAEEEKKGTRLFIIEAALLLEDHYDEICHEIWYVYAQDSVRERRLKLSRGYSQEKIASIFRVQKTRDEFLEKCHRAIDNSADFGTTCAQMQEILAQLDIEPGGGKSDI